MDVDTDVFLSMHSTSALGGFLFQSPMVFPSVDKGRHMKSNFAVHKALTESNSFIPAEVILNLLWFSLRPDPTHLKFRGKQTDLKD